MSTTLTVLAVRALVTVYAVRSVHTNVSLVTIRCMSRLRYHSPFASFRLRMMSCSLSIAIFGRRCISACSSDTTIRLVATLVAGHLRLLFAVRKEWMGDHRSILLAFGMHTKIFPEILNICQSLFTTHGWSDRERASHGATAHWNRRR